MPRFRHYAPGSQQTADWARQPFRPGPYSATGFTTIDCTLLPTTRSRGDIHVELVNLQNLPDGLDFLQSVKATSRTMRLYRDNRLVGTSHSSAADFTVPEVAASYQLTYTDNTAAALPVSTQTQTTWTFRSAAPRGPSGASPATRGLAHARMCHPVTAVVAMAEEHSATTDAELIRLSLRDPEHFAPLFDRHAAELRRYALGRLGPDLADDITAETFLTAFRKRGRYDLGRDDARPWLYGIATRWISEHRRVELRRYRNLARTPTPEPPEPFEEAADDRVSARQMLPVVAGVLAGLSAAERDLLLLVAWTDLSYDDIARSLAVAPGTVASRLHRIRRKVRALLSQHGHTD